mgnify:CR=1
MDDAKREVMNEKIDILFDQISELEGESMNKAAYAVELWRSAKTQEHLGLGPMESRSVYRTAYEVLRDLGLEVGGMIKPYEPA